MGFLAGVVGAGLWCDGWAVCGVEVGFGALVLWGWGCKLVFLGVGRAVNGGS